MASTGAGGQPRKVSELVAEAKAKIDNLTVDQTAAAISEGALAVDLREPEERARDGAIPGAVHAPRGMLEFYADPSSPYHRAELTPDRRIVLYCAGGGRSALAAVALQALGYTNVSHLDGGIKAWKQAGRPTEPA
jgi:rhodanese-related sulfurtransferase